MLSMVDVNEDVNTFKNIENISAPLAVSCNIDVMNSMKLRRFKCLNVHTWAYVCTCVCMRACVYAYVCVCVCARACVRMTHIGAGPG